MLDRHQQQRLRTLFAQAVERPEDDRAAFVARECEDDPAVRRELESMLIVHREENGSFLDSPRITVERSLRVEPPKIEGYCQIEAISEGGMGTVFKARQTHPVRRTVALKVIKKGMDSDAVLRRFEAERQAMAMMTHPYIATVHDAGTDCDGRPFIAMEFVAGAPITEFCEAEQLGLELRLQLLAKVCHAIEHAHRRGVLHRDLKPSNVLVARHDDELVPKVIDFGIAKALQNPLGEHTILTEQGLFLGTLEYMSPEQVGGSAHQIDTRTDVYALGVILYELLTMSLPFASHELREADFAQLQQIVQDRVPPKPSTRLRQRAATEVEALDRTRCTTQWQRHLAGDLDWVTMKALEKEPERRYSSPRELALDIENFLAHRPVTAGPPSGWYRARKFVRRYRVQVIAAALVLVSLVAGLFGTLWFLVEANERAAESEVARRNAEGARLATEALRQAQDNPGLALLLALEADDLADQQNKYAVRNAIYETLPHHRETQVLVGHDHAVRQVLFLPDGQRLVSQASEPAALLWEVGSGELLRRFVGHEDVLTRIDLDASGNRLLTTSQDGTARVFRVETGEVIHVLRGHSGPLDFGAFSPGGNHIATASRDKTARIYDASSGRVLHVLSGHERLVSCLAFDSSGDRLATLSLDSKCRVWNVHTGGLERTYSDYLDYGDSRDPKVVAEWQNLWCQPGGEHIVTFCSTFGASHEVRIDSWREELRWRIPNGRSPAFLEAGKRLLVPENRATFAREGPPDWLSDIDLRSRVRQPQPARGRRYVNAVSQDGRYAAFTDSRNDIELVDLQRQVSLGYCRGHEYKSFRYPAAFSPGGTRLATGGNTSGRVRVWETLPEFGPDDLGGSAVPGVDCLSVTSKGGRAVVQQRIGGRSVWAVIDTETMQPACVIDGDPQLMGVRISPDGNRVIGAMSQAMGHRKCDRVVVYDGKGRVLGEIVLERPVISNHLRFGADGRVLGVGVRPDSGEQGAAHYFAFYDLQTLELVRRSESPFNGTLSWSDVPGDGRVAAVYHGACRTDVLDATTGEVLASMKGPERVTHLRAAFSPDGRHLLLTLADLSAQVWDLQGDMSSERARPVARYHDLAPNAMWCGFADGGRLAWAGCNDEVHIFEALTGAPFAVLRLDAQIACVRRVGTELVTLTIDGIMQRWTFDPIAVARRRARGALDPDKLNTYRIGTSEQRLRRERDLLHAQPRPRSWERFGELELQQGDLDAAIRCYQAACELGPHGPRDRRLYVKLVALLCQRLAGGENAPEQSAADRSRAIEALANALRCGAAREDLLKLQGFGQLINHERFRELMER